MPFVMKYGGTVGAGIKRLFLPESLKEKLVPTHVDPNIPYEHLMNVKWNFDVIKYGLLHWYSGRYHDKSFRFGQLRSKNSKNIFYITLTNCQWQWKWAYHNLELSDRVKIEQNFELGSVIWIIVKRRLLICWKISMTNRYASPRSTCS